MSWKADGEDAKPHRTSVNHTKLPGSKLSFVIMSDGNAKMCHGVSARMQSAYR